MIEKKKGAIRARSKIENYLKKNDIRGKIQCFDLILVYLECLEE